jgi:hypothetical protein
MSFKSRLCAIAFLIAGLTASCAPQPKLTQPIRVLGNPPVYDYPINNPYAATIIGVPPEMKVDYSSVPALQDRTITLFKDRVVPEGFWYQRGFKYSELLQTTPAPLVYVIAGTGADSHSESPHTIADILYSAGFSVVILPSPTHPNFIINASRNFITGNPVQDSEDLYRIMKVVDTQVALEAKVTQRMLVGYSLGGLDVVFTARLDDEQKAFNFSRVLLINPPLSLYSSMQVLDTMLYQALPDGINDAARFVKTAVRRLSRINQSSDALNFSNERLLIDAYNKYQPSDARLATVIGLSFRLAAADMIFTADVMSRSGYIYPKDRDFTTSTSLNDYFAVALRTSFRNYFDELYMQKYQAQNPRMTKQDVIAESSMESMAGYIASHPNIGLITNRDDIILAPGEEAKLVALFGKNATVFPSGGHLGNLGTPSVAYRIILFLER